MSDFNNYQNRMAQTGAQSGEMIDQGLRSYMLRVYNLMAVGLGITAVAALVIASLATTNDPSMAAAELRNGTLLTSLGAAIYLSPLRWAIMFAPLAVVFFLSFRVHKMSVSAAQATFWGYATLVGLSLSSIFIIYTAESIVQTLFVTAASFGALSLFGYTTKRDLTAFGSFLIMGLFGLIIAMIVNIFLQSSMMGWIISVAGVLIFAGLTAYDTQKIKEMYWDGHDEVTTGRMAIMGALTLYLDFINLFSFLLSFLGNRDE